jgi:hypothetical protein
MSVAADPKAVFWRFGLLAVALVGLSTLVIRFCGDQSTAAMVVLPVFFLLFQVPYALVALVTEGRGVFRELFFGSPWLVIPFWAILVFLWNGSLAALLAYAYARLRKHI